ncbi:hypothetical protein NIES4106_49980 [Fischerella sp. NIES-4106]|jgi:hypothetical protein|nr:hypothetical protein NIES4106_49980 [Fischerella sp. NIES-4106]
MNKILTELDEQTKVYIFFNIMTGARDYSKASRSGKDFTEKNYSSSAPWTFSNNAPKAQPTKIKLKDSKAALNISPPICCDSPFLRIVELG